MQQVWNSNQIYVAQVLSLRDVGDRLPVPNEPGTIPKEGIQVQIAGYTDFSTEMKNLQREAANRAICGDRRSTPQISRSDIFWPDFHIDWCSFRLITPSMPDSFQYSTPAPTPIRLTGDQFDYATAGIECRDLRLEFGAIVVFPLVLMLIMLLILSYAMFGRREGVETRDEKTPPTQMSQFNTITRATTNLRMMSHHRDGPPPLRSNYASRAGSEASTLPRSQAPPPYRLPPSYPTNSFSRRSAPVSRESTLTRPLNRFRSEPWMNEHEHLIGIDIEHDNPVPASSDNDE